MNPPYQDMLLLDMIYLSHKVYWNVASNYLLSNDVGRTNFDSNVSLNSIITQYRKNQRFTITAILDEDFATDSDLFMACTILKKQIECIDGKKENIIVPSVAMRKYREKLPTGKKME